MAKILDCDVEVKAESIGWKITGRDAGKLNAASNRGLDYTTIVSRPQSPCGIYMISHTSLLGAVQKGTPQAQQLLSELQASAPLAVAS